MIDTLVLIAIGAFIGWNIPQPFYAVWIQNWVMDKIKNFGNNAPK